MPARANRVELPQARSPGKLSRPKSTRAYIWTGLIWSDSVISNPRGGMTAPVPAPTPRYRGCSTPGARLLGVDAEDAELEGQGGVVADQGRQLDQGLLAEGGDGLVVLLVIQVGR